MCLVQSSSHLITWSYDDEGLGGFFLGMRLLKTTVRRVRASLELERGIFTFSFMIKQKQKQTNKKNSGRNKPFSNFDLNQKSVF